MNKISMQMLNVFYDQPIFFHNIYCQPFQHRNKHFFLFEKQQQDNFIK